VRLFLIVLSIAVLVPAFCGLTAYLSYRLWPESLLARACDLLAKVGMPMLARLMSALESLGYWLSRPSRQPPKIGRASGRGRG